MNLAAADVSPLKLHGPAKEADESDGSEPRNLAGLPQQAYLGFSMNP